jgi:hypothetical protein
MSKKLKYSINKYIFKLVVTSQFYKMMHVFFSNTNKTVKNKMLLDKFK